MANDAPEIKVKLTAEDQGVAAAIKELGVQLKTLKTHEEGAASSALALGSALRGVASAGALIGIGLIAKAALDSAVNIGKMADKTGASTQSLSVFHHVAEELGIETESVDKALVKASKSITQFEQGSKTAAQGFALLGLTQKQFIGLNSDQKLLLVTNALGKMTAGAQKATAAQLIFSRGGADFIPVANAIAGEGYDKITASVSKLGLLLTRDMTNAAQVAKASLQELQDVGAGMATQLEAGMLPAITDVADALVGMGERGVDSFKELGKTAGDAIRQISFLFFELGDSVGAIIAQIGAEFGSVWDELKIGGKAAVEAFSEQAKGNFLGAFRTLKDAARDLVRSHNDTAAQIKAIWDQTAVDIQKKQEQLLPSDDESERRAREAAARLKPEHTSEVPLPQLAAESPNDAAEKAAAAQFEKYLQDELSLLRASAKQTEEIEKEKYDQGELSLAEYFNRRRAAITADAAEESAITQREITAQVHAAETAAVASKNAPNAKDKDKAEAEKTQALTRVMDLQTKLQESEIAASTKIRALDDEEFKAREENQQKVLEFQKQVAQLQGKTQEITREEIALETQKLRIALEQAGQSKAQVDAELAQFTQLKTAQADFEAAKKKIEQDEKAFELEKQNIQIKAKAAGQSALETERQINQLIRDRLPLLQADAAAELGAAQKTGNQEDIASGQNAVQGVQNITVATDSLQKQLRGSLTQDFTNFFETVGRGTQTVAQSFESLAASMIQSLQKVLAEKLMDKILGKDSSGGDGSGDGSGSGSGGGGLGGILGGLLGMFGGHAGGGPIKGPGGPTADGIPARLSSGEFVVKASAVNAFGAHNLEAINRGLQMPSIKDLNLALPKYAEGGLVGADAGSDSRSSMNIGIGLDEGLILRHLSSKAAGRLILHHVTENPKAVNHALGRSR